MARLRQPLHDPPIEITISLLTPFAAYLPAEALGVSGVLATVACGLYLGRQEERLLDANTRLQSRAVWDTGVFLLNGLVFVLIGLQLPRIVAASLAGRSPLTLAALAAAVTGTVLVVRFVWVFATDWLAHPRRPARDNPIAWAQDAVISWAGLRGVVSLAAALALPFTTASGDPFPERDLLIFLTVCVIVVTLVGQGLTLPWLLRMLRVSEDGSDEQDEAVARQAATEAAQARLESLAVEWPGHLPLIDTLRAQYSHRASHFSDASQGEDPAAPSAAEQELMEHRTIHRAVIDAERTAIIDLRARGDISEDAWRRVERDLDLEELRMEA